jgi:hypothetical protein
MNYSWLGLDGHYKNKVPNRIKGAHLFNNGKRIEIPSSKTHTPEQIYRAAGQDSRKKMILIEKPRVTGRGRFQKMDRATYIEKEDKVVFVPVRVKGNLYGKPKNPIQQEIILSQARDISENSPFKQIEISDDFHTILIKDFILPESWALVNGKKRTAMMIILPDDFPEIPPNGFYLPNILIPPANERHFFDRGFHGAYGSTEEEISHLKEKGWKWYCTNIVEGAWTPASINHRNHIDNWRRGDNLWHILKLIEEVLYDPLSE